MATVVETRASTVLQLTIPAQLLTEAPTQRVSTQHSLSYPYIERNMSPNKVAEMRFDGKRWVLIAPHGAYTSGVHLMVMRWESECTPDFATVRPQEVKELMPFFANLAREIFKRSHAQEVIFGYHYSPYSLLQEGYQSVPTMVHPYIFEAFNLTKGDPRYMNLVKREALPHKDRKAIQGGIYNERFGRFLVDHTLNGQFKGDSGLLNRLFDMGQAQVDLHGVRVPTRGTLEETLRTPGFSDGFLQPFDSTMARYAEDLSRTFTDFDPRDTRRKIDEAVLSRKEPEDEAMQAVLAEITNLPNLLDRSERTRRIQLLGERGYSAELIDYLTHISDRRLPDSGPIERWKRGFAYTFALGQDTETGQGFMAISVGVKNGPGGVVENVLGARLVRPADPFTREEMEAKKARISEIVRALGSSVIQTLGTCPVKKICTDFRRESTDCMMSGDRCMNDPAAWGRQYDRYLEDVVDNRRPSVYMDFQPLKQILPPTQQC